MTTPPRPPTSADSVAERVQHALGDAMHIVRELGGGGMSRVFVAHERALAREVVVKVLREDIAEGLSRERFRREVQTAAILQHPNIVGVIAAGDADGLPYFVMPLVEGKSLRARLASGPALSIAHTVSILRDVARALAFAHERGIVHRDIKPDNVLLAGGAAVVADFGVAKAVATARSRREHPHGTLTQDGISLGTPAYMAPEQVASDPSMDHRADVYALGVVAYEMLVGHPPFADRGVTEIMQAHLVETPRPIARFRPTTPSALSALVMRCLEKDPAHRPQSATEILYVLDDPAVVSGALSSASVRSLSTSGRLVARRWWMSAAVALAAVALAAVALAAVALAAVAIGIVSMRAREIDEAPSTADAVAILPPGVAVLPLVSVSPDSSDAYLALGMTDEITSALSRVRGFRVVSRSAAAAAQATGGTVGEVATRLGVPFLLEGTVQRVGARMRVAVRLVTARDGFSAWSEVYERPTGDLLAVQADIAARIAAAVRSDLTAEVAIDVTGSRDPAFARTYAELFQAYAALPASSGVGRTDALDRATFAAQRAVALDSSCAARYAALGVAHHLQWRWSEARGALERALAIDSNDVVALRRLALSDLVNGDAATARGAYARDSTSVDARLMLATALLRVGRAPEAVPVLEAMRGGDAVSPEVLGSLGFALARVGRTSEARSILAGLRRETRRPGVYPAMAKVYLGLNERDWAIDALTWATAARDDFFARESMASPVFDLVRSDPRFARVVEIVGLDLHRLKVPARPRSA